MPIERHAIAIAAILLFFPVFIFPLEVEMAFSRPVGFTG
jgi:hypothetical protein